MNKAMSIPTVSIIIPVHNVAPYLETCLDSLLSQTFQDWEAVCIDDGSSDESPAMLDRFAARDARFKVVHQKNGGVSNARNTGLKLARGTYIQMLDPDDWAEPDMTERLLRMIESTHAELGVCGCFYHHTATGETGRRMPDKFSAGPDSVSVHGLDSRVTGNITFCVWDKIFRRSIIEQFQLAFQPGLKIGEDMKFIMEYLSCCHNIAFLARPLYHYRSGAGVTGKTRPVWERLSFQELLESLDVLDSLAGSTPGKLKGRRSRDFHAGLLQAVLMHRAYMKELLEGMPGQQLRRLLRRSHFPLPRLLLKSSFRPSMKSLLEFYIKNPLRTFLRQKRR